MMESKLRIKASQIVFVLLVMSIIGVGYIALQDVLKTPADRLADGIAFLEQKNYAAAESALVRAAQTEEKQVAITAAWRVGNLYRLGAPEFQMNGRKAELFLERAASLGYAPAQYELALMYNNGDKIPENRQKAMAWMNHAAQAGLPEALYALGVWVERGYFGPVDMKKVMTLYEQAAQKNHINAMKSLIVLYSEGWDHFPRNEERMVYWADQLNQRMQAHSKSQPQQVDLKLPPQKGDSKSQPQQAGVKGKASQTGLKLPQQIDTPIPVKPVLKEKEPLMEQKISKEQSSSDDKKILKEEKKK